MEHTELYIYTYIYIWKNGRIVYSTYIYMANKLPKPKGENKKRKIDAKQKRIVRQ